MRVQAVVVTFNRLAMLQRLVPRLQEIAGLERILVVDNASTDGTGEWLKGFEARSARTSTDAASSARTSTDGASSARTATDGTAARVEYETLTANTGGAGGFHHGLDWAVREGADLVWLMDDDGLPALDCLDLLLERQQRDGLEFCGPAVLAEQDPSRLCFPIRLPGGTRVVHDMAAVEAAARDGLIDDVVIPFNGVLVTRDLVERIGLPREEFFIWGDDVEYLWRAQRAGARIATVVDAHFLHPATDDLGTPMMFGRTTYNHTASDLKHYCMARNNTLNLRAYRGWVHVLLFWLKTVWFYLFTKPQPARIPLSARAAAAGLRGDFTGHRRYLT